MATSSLLTGLLRRLARPAPAGLFNPYRDRDLRLDLASGPARRRANLREYVDAFAGARLVLVGEAAGYNGCRFSGIPFTGEDLLVGEAALPWARERRLRRSSRGQRLSRERSANIVWGQLGGRRDVVLWNAVPWHPHRTGEPLSNRPPRSGDINAGRSYLESFLELFPAATPVAVGRVAQRALATLAIDAPYLRHPSMGGQRQFERGLRELLR